MAEIRQQRAGATKKRKGGINEFPFTVVSVAESFTGIVGFVFQQTSMVVRCTRSVATASTIDVSTV